MKRPFDDSQISIGPKVLTDLLTVYVDPDIAMEMADAVIEDMRLINFPLRRATFNPPHLWKDAGVIEQGEYDLPPNQFYINSPVGSESLEGSFLTCGNLLRLGQCVLIGRKYLPALWPATFAKRLLGREHLDTLNEVWWLKFWRGIECVVPGPKESANHPDFEWEIHINDGLTKSRINLEVKRRTSNINKFFKERRPNASVNKIAKKFQETNEGTANVAALTLYHNIPEEVHRSLRRWFDSQANLHGLLIWTEGHRGEPPLRKYFKPTHRWVEFLLNDPEPEDLKVAGRASGTLCEVDEIHHFLENLAHNSGQPVIHRPW